MEIDPAADEWPYAQVAAWYREQIRSGKLASGTWLPSVRQIHAETGLTEKSVRHALAVLQDEGLVRVVANRGTVVV
jgi:DNA-binding transcriptional regulator YhcF (GntR family)